ncbi:MAG TPA: hypothetical protein VLA83_14450 [Candidatus Binatia bacterium]|nr:hypothetical protein [Candidatus Binatia bacterium]
MITAAREAIYKRWTRLLERPFWRLVAHFGMKLFSGNGEGGLELGAGTVLALLAAPGAFISILLLDKYSSLLRFLRGNHNFDPYATSVPDQYFFLTFSMAITGIVTVLKWDSIFPDRRDYMNLAPLPIATRRIFLANIAAIVLIAVAFAVDVNAVSSLLFPMVVTMEEPKFAAYVQFARAHFAGVLLASLFVSFALFALIGALMVLLPDNVFRRISIYVRVLVVIVLLALLCSTFAVAPLLSTLHADVPSFLRWLPPVWFLGLSRTILGRTDAAMAQMGAIGLWAVIAAAILAPLVYVLSYYRYFIRIPETLDTTLKSRAPRIEFPIRLMDWFVLRTTYERAIYRFSMKTLWRNDRHSLILGGFAGLGIVIASQTLLSAVNQKPGVAPSAALISVPFTLAYFLICGLRFVFDLPAELRANWVHRVILDHEQQAPADAARKVILAFVLPWILLVCLPLYLYYWGWSVGSALAAVLVAGCYLLADVLLRRFAKIPFACSYPAWKQSATVIVLFYVLGLWAFASLLPRLEHALLLKGVWCLWGLVLVVQAVRLVLRRLRDDDPRSRVLVFEEAPDSPFELLNLSGN